MLKGAVGGTGEVLKRPPRVAGALRTRFLAVAVMPLLMAGCAAVESAGGTGEPAEAPADTSAATSADAQTELGSAGLEVGSDMIRGIPTKIGDYFMVQQPEAREAGYCLAEQPQVLGDNALSMTYLTPAMVSNIPLSLADSTVDCWHIEPQSAPSEAEFVNWEAIQLTVARDDTVLVKEGAELPEGEVLCTTWPEDSYVRCEMQYDDWSILGAADANFTDLDRGEEVLSAFLEAAMNEDVLLY